MVLIILKMEVKGKRTVIKEGSRVKGRTLPVLLAKLYFYVL